MVEGRVTSPLLQRRKSMKLNNESQDKLQCKCTFARSRTIQSSNIVHCWDRVALYYMKKDLEEARNRDTRKLFQQFPINSCPLVGQQTKSGLWEGGKKNHSHHIFDFDMRKQQHFVLASRRNRQVSLQSLQIQQITASQL